MSDTYRIVVSEQVLEHARNALLGDRRLHHYCSTCTAFRKAMMLAEFHPDIPDEEEIAR